MPNVLDKLLGKPQGSESPYRSSVVPAVTDLQGAIDAVRKLLPIPIVAGGVLFGGPSGTIAADSANLFWDNTAITGKRLAVGPGSAAVMSALSGDTFTKLVVYNADAVESSFGYAALGFGSKFQGGYAGTEIDYNIVTGAGVWRALYSMGAETSDDTTLNSRDFFFYDNVAGFYKMSLKGDGSIIFGNIPVGLSSGITLRVHPASNGVGIGLTTGSPGAHLHVQAAADGLISLLETPNGGFRFDYGSAVATMGARGTAVDIALAPTIGGVATEAVRIKSGGNVGIGTTSPAAKFAVSDSTNGLETVPGTPTILQAVARPSAAYVDLIIKGRDVTFVANNTTSLILHNSTGDVELPNLNEKLILASDMWMTKAAASPTPRVEFQTSQQDSQWLYTKAVTANNSNFKSLLKAQVSFDVATDGLDLGRTSEINAIVGQNNAASKSTAGAIAFSTLVYNLAGGTGIAEPFVILTYLRADVLSAANNHSKVNYWLYDDNVIGPKSGQEGYLSGGTKIVTKYASGNTIDATHMGSHIASFCTTPYGGVDAPTRAGQGLTSYQLADGIVINGFAGPLDTISSGSDAAATSAFVNALRIGGPDGAAWMAGRQSKYDRGIDISQYLTYGIRIHDRHGAGTGVAFYAIDGSGGLGVWRDPTGLGDTIPIVGGKSVNSEQLVRIWNENTGSAAVAIFECKADSGLARLTQASVAAGGAGSVGSDGNMYVYAGTSKVIVHRIAGTDYVQQSTTALSPFANDGNALGTSTLKWSDLFLASGAVIDFAAGDVTITHSTNQLAFAGASTAYTFDAPLLVGVTSIITSGDIAEFDLNQNANTYVKVRNVNGSSAARAGVAFGNNNANQRAGVFLNGGATTDYGGADSLNLINFGAFPVTLGANNAVVLTILSAGNVKFTNAANFTANGTVATAMSSLGPTGSHTTIQKWLTIVDNGGTTGYIPVF